MRKNIIILLLALVVIIESVALLTNRKQHICINEENVAVDSIETIQDSTFTLLMNENTACYCVFNINYKGDLLSYYGDEAKRVTWFGNVSDKSKITEMLGKRGFPKENEACHLALDVRTPKDSIEMFKKTLISVGIYECELTNMHNHSQPVIVSHDTKVERLPAPGEMTQVKL